MRTARARLLVACLAAYAPLFAQGLGSSINLDSCLSPDEWGDSSLKADYALLEGYADSSGQRLQYQRYGGEITAQGPELQCRYWESLDLPDAYWNSPALSDEAAKPSCGIGLSYRGIATLNAWLVEDRALARADASIPIASGLRLGVEAGALDSLTTKIALSHSPFANSIALGFELWGGSLSCVYDDGRWNASLSCAAGSSPASSGDAERFFSDIPWAAWGRAGFGFRAERWYAKLEGALGAAELRPIPASVSYIASDALAPLIAGASAEIGIKGALSLRARYIGAYLPAGAASLGSSSSQGFLYWLRYGEGSLSWTSLSAQAIGGSLGFVAKRGGFRGDFSFGYDALACSGSVAYRGAGASLLFPAAAEYSYTLSDIIDGACNLSASIEAKVGLRQRLKVDAAQYIPIPHASTGANSSASSSSGATTSASGSSSSSSASSGQSSSAKAWSYGGLALSASWVLDL
jgi:hypothetical protein